MNLSRDWEVAVGEAGSTEATIIVLTALFDTDSEHAEKLCDAASSIDSSLLFPSLSSLGMDRVSSQLTPCSLDDLASYACNVDSRDVLTHLISSLSAGQLTHSSLWNSVRCRVLVSVLKRTYRQLFVDTLRRRLRSEPQTSWGKTLERVRTSMHVWARDVIDLVQSVVLPALYRSDALPQMVDVSFLGDVSDRHLSSAASPTVGEGEDDRESEIVSDTVQETLDLLSDIHRTTGLVEEVVSCSIALYGAAIGAQKCHSSLLLWGVPCGERLEHAHVRLITHTNHAARERQNYSSLQPSGVAVDARILEAVSSYTRVLVECMCGENSYADYLLRLLGPELLKEDLSGACLFEDFEKGGTTASAEKMMVLWQAHEKSLSTATVFPWVTQRGKHSEHKEERTSCSLFKRHGALLLFAGDFLHPTGSVPFSVAGAFSGSPTSLLVAVVDSIGSALQSSSQTVTLCTLLLLDALIAAVPHLSLAVHGESVKVHSNSGSFSVSSPLSSHSTSYHTHAYATMFEVVKQLVSISAVCPAEPLRSLAQGLTTEFINCYDAPSQARILCSLLALCPYPSVSRYFVGCLQNLWDAYSQRDESPSSVFERDMPEGLVQALRFFIQHLRAGEAGFVDPIIVTLNFFRVFLSKDSSKPPGRRRLCYDAEVQWRAFDDQSASASAKGSGWAIAFNELHIRDLPNCRALLHGGVASRDGEVRVPVVAAAPLSPLDEYALVNALEGLPL